VVLEVVDWLVTVIVIVVDIIVVDFVDIVVVEFLDIVFVGFVKDMVDVVVEDKGEQECFQK
jgi:hypothetical protein